jgi:hypothetical protein
MTTPNTAVWLFADLAEWAACEHPATGLVCGRAHRWYACACASHLVDADRLETMAIDAATRRDRARLTTPGTVLRRNIALHLWQRARRPELRQRRQSMLRRIVIDPTGEQRLILHWQTEATLAAASPPPVDPRRRRRCGCNWGPNSSWASTPQTLPASASTCSQTAETSTSSGSLSAGTAGRWPRVGEVWVVPALASAPPSGGYGALSRQSRRQTATAICPCWRMK